MRVTKVIDTVTAAVTAGDFELPVYSNQPVSLLATGLGAGEVVDILMRVPGGYELVYDGATQVQLVYQSQNPLVLPITGIFTFIKGITAGPVTVTATRAGRGV